MDTLNIHIMVGSRGVSRVVAVGRSTEDRSRALDFLTRIDPELAAIDRAAKESEEEESAK